MFAHANKRGLGGSYFMNVSRSYRLSWDRFLSETTPDDRSLIRELLCNATTYFVEHNRAVFLEQFGIVSPHTQTKHASVIKKNSSYSCQEKYLTLQFEKCLDLVGFYRAKHRNIVETPELAKYLYAKLPIEKQIEWDERRLCSYIRTILRGVRDEIVIEGVSAQLGSLGTFYSLHNRQGADLRDWYAGSDIFLVPSYSNPIEAEKPKRFPRPVLKNPWEPFEALYGKHSAQYTVHVKKELARLGYDTSEFEQEVKPELRNFKVRVYLDESTNTLLSISNGLRFLSSYVEDRAITGNEIIFQQAAPTESPSTPQHQPHLFTLAWLLIMGRPSKLLRTGMTLSTERPLLETSGCKVFGVFVTPFTPIQSVQKTKDMNFKYMNLVGITPEESHLAERSSPAHLFELLRFRKYDQVTRPGRPAVTHRTGFSGASHNTHQAA